MYIFQWYGQGEIWCVVVLSIELFFFHYSRIIHNPFCLTCLRILLYYCIRHLPPAHYNIFPELLYASNSQLTYTVPTLASVRPTQKPS